VKCNAVSLHSLYSILVMKVASEQKGNCSLTMVQATSIYYYRVINK